MREPADPPRPFTPEQVEGEELAEQLLSIRSRCFAWMTRAECDALKDAARLLRQPPADEIRRKLLAMRDAIDNDDSYQGDLRDGYAVGRMEIINDWLIWLGKNTPTETLERLTSEPSPCVSTPKVLTADDLAHGFTKETQ